MRAGKWLIRRLDERLTSPQFRWRQIADIYVPLLLDQLFIFGIGVLSVAMVSNSGEAAIAAVSMVGSVAFILVGLFTGIALGGGIVAARAKGAGDPVMIGKAAGETILVSTLIALTLSGVVAACAEPIVDLLYPNAEALLRRYAVDYLRLYSYSNIPYALYCAVSNVYRGTGDSRSSLVLTVVINSVHLVCSFLFITVLGMGVTGSGLSYIVARVVGVVVALLWIFRIHPLPGFRARYMFHASRGIVKQILSLGLPLALEQILFQVGILVTQVFIATLSTAAIAAHAVANSLLNILLSPAFALSSLASTVCGQCVGARDVPLVRKYTVNLIRIGRWMMLATALLFLPCMPLLLKLYAPSAEAYPIIWRSLAFVLAPFVLFWCDAYVPASSMRAAGDTLATTLMTLAAMWLGRVALGYCLAIPLGLGVTGVWLGLAAEWLLRALLLRTRFSGEAWLAGLSSKAHEDA